MSTRAMESLTFFFLNSRILLLHSKVLLTLQKMSFILRALLKTDPFTCGRPKLVTTRNCFTRLKGFQLYMIMGLLHSSVHALLFSPCSAQPWSRIPCSCRVHLNISPLPASFPAPRKCACKLEMLLVSFIACIDVDFVRREKRVRGSVFFFKDPPCKPIAQVGDHAPI